MRPCRAPSASDPPGTDLSARLRNGLDLLLRAWDYAQALQCDVWDFAVGRQDLQAVGLTDTDLRWLLGQGLIDHAIEETGPTDPGRVFHKSLNLALFERSCVVLTPSGIDQLRQKWEDMSEALSHHGKGVIEQAAGREHRGRPHWDEATHTLYWHGCIVKHFRHDAPNQVAVLYTLQAQRRARWVSIEPKEIGTKEHLHDTIKNLNRNVRPYLRFNQEGSGNRVGWKPMC